MLLRRAAPALRRLPLRRPVACSAMPPAFPRPIIQPASGRHSATVFVLHGLGDTGDGWSFLGPHLGMRHVKFVYPTAPTRPVTLNGGMMMPAWFDLDTLDNVERMLGGQLDHEGISESVEYVKGLVGDEVAAGVPAGRIVVMGFSQGGHVALKAALGMGEPAAAGCVALSTWLEPLAFEVPEAMKSMPIFVAHGEADPLVPLGLGTATKQMLTRRGFTNVNFQQYPGMGHSSCPQELNDVKEFLLKAVPEERVPRPSRDAVDTMSTKALKQFLAEEGIDTKGMLEKQEFVDKAKSLL